MPRANAKRPATWLLLVVGVACGAPRPPTGPAPEYEKPVYPAWDAGQVIPEKDPFELDPAQMVPPLPAADAGTDAGVSDVGAAVDGAAAPNPATETSARNEPELRTAAFAYGSDLEERR